MTADHPSYQFVYAAKHGKWTVYIGLESKTRELHVLLPVSIDKDVRSKLRSHFGKKPEYERFLRELGRDLMEPGTSYNFDRTTEEELQGFTSRAKLYPFDPPGVSRKDLEAAIQSVVSAGVRGIYYLTDLLQEEGGAAPTKWSPPSDPFGTMYG